MPKKITLPVGYAPPANFPRSFSAPSGILFLHESGLQAVTKINFLFAGI
jgi:hypothetical protein